MKLPEIPETLPREKAIEFLNSVGIDPKWCAGFELTQGGIYADMFARSEEGNKIISGADVAMHKVFIRFT